MISVFNPAATGDVLMLTFAPSTGHQEVDTKGNVTVVKKPENGDVVAINLANLAQELGLSTNKSGQVFLTEKQVDLINQELAKVGIDFKINTDPSKLVIGVVEEMTEHPDSDHLHVTKVDVGENDRLQIVSGSPNMATGIKVVVAQPGAMMPSGEIIWPGALRGVPSAGMIVSGRELQLAGAPDKPGALVLPDDFGSIGEVFDFDQAKDLYKDGRIDTNY
ncbi:YtpR family tRNA-binding protein [Fructobacillus fructosus]|uniref:YtpR family tRNA-binding protein n=1 Tax=Fructobacillus fructosus TaxID=1631 RepID=UPI002D9FFF4B|nr:tRNA-binding EMAP/Myf domain (EMAP) [Fructobacillus fructosus]CAK1232056.1 tRNA-binding EMAP/Myf domain (EMAP) [Fructobacillus fructosus]CAK1232726.1 tRNA-binding EMAP/Myf domain (EMAP) [Fructobacillus fructosus]